MTEQDTTQQTTETGTKPADEPTAREREASPDASSQAPLADAREPLLPAGETEGFANRWQEIQADFVDEPRQSVHRADDLVEELMNRVSATFGTERGRLEQVWDSGDDVSTEDLRVALQRYRSFFDRLLSA